MILADGTASVTTDPMAWLINLGVAGVVIILLVTGRLRTKSEVDNLTKENERKDVLIDSKDAQIAALQDAIINKTIPAIAESARVLEVLPQSQRAVFSQLRRAQSEVARLTAEADRMSRDTRE